MIISISVLFFTWWQKLGPYFFLYLFFLSFFKAYKEVVSTKFKMNIVKISNNFFHCIILHLIGGGLNWSFGDFIKSTTGLLSLCCMTNNINFYWIYLIIAFVAAKVNKPVKLQPLKGNIQWQSGTNMTAQFRKFHNCIMTFQITNMLITNLANI